MGVGLGSELNAAMMAMIAGRAATIAWSKAAQLTLVGFAVDAVETVPSGFWVMENVGGRAVIGIGFLSDY